MFLEGITQSVLDDGEGKELLKTTVYSICMDMYERSRGTVGISLPHFHLASSLMLAVKARDSPSWVSENPLGKRRKLMVVFLFVHGL